MKILILGAGKMGRFFADTLSFHHEVCLFDTDPKQLRFVYNAHPHHRPGKKGAGV